MIANRFLQQAPLRLQTASQLLSDKQFSESYTHYVAVAEESISLLKQANLQIRDVSMPVLIHEDQISEIVQCTDECLVNIKLIHQMVNRTNSREGVRGLSGHHHRTNRSVSTIGVVSASSSSGSSSSGGRGSGSASGGYPVNNSSRQTHHSSGSSSSSGRGAAKKSSEDTSSNDGGTNDGTTTNSVNGSRNSSSSNELDVAKSNNQNSNNNNNSNNSVGSSPSPPPSSLQQPPQPPYNSFTNRSSSLIHPSPPSNRDRGYSTHSYFDRNNSLNLTNNNSNNSNNSSSNSTVVRTLNNSKFKWSNIGYTADKWTRFVDSNFDYLRMSRDLLRNDYNFLSEFWKKFMQIDPNREYVDSSLQYQIKKYFIDYLRMICRLESHAIHRTFAAFGLKVIRHYDSGFLTKLDDTKKVEQAREVVDKAVIDIGSFCDRFMHALLKRHWFQFMGNDVYRLLAGLEDDIYYCLLDELLSHRNIYDKVFALYCVIHAKSDLELEQRISQLCALSIEFFEVEEQFQLLPLLGTEGSANTTATNGTSTTPNTTTPATPTTTTTTTSTTPRTPTATTTTATNTATNASATPTTTPTTPVPTQDVPYQSAINILSTINDDDKLAPSAITSCLINTIQEISNCVIAYYSRLDIGEKELENVHLAADDLLSIFIYVLCHAKPRNMHATLNYLNSFMNQDLMKGEEGYCLATLETGINHILQLDIQAMLLQHRVVLFEREQLRKPLPPPPSPKTKRNSFKHPLDPNYRSDSSSNSNSRRSITQMRKLYEDLCQQAVDQERMWHTTQGLTFLEKRGRSAVDERKK